MQSWPHGSAAEGKVDLSHHLFGDSGPDTQYDMLPPAGIQGGQQHACPMVVNQMSRFESRPTAQVAVAISPPFEQMSVKIMLVPEESTASHAQGPLMSDAAGVLEYMDASMMLDRHNPPVDQNNQFAPARRGRFSFEGTSLVSI